MSACARTAAVCDEAQVIGALLCRGPLAYETASDCGLSIRDFSMPLFGRLYALLQMEFGGVDVLDPPRLIETIERSDLFGTDRTNPDVCDVSLLVGLCERCEIETEAEMFALCERVRERTQEVAA